MDFVLIVEGIKEEVLREDLRHMKEIANIAFDTENPEETAEKIEEYFKFNNCEYVLVDVFAYNEKAINFYNKKGYHPRMYTNIKKLK